MESKYQFAQELIREMGSFLRAHLHDELRIEQKSHFTDLVTHLDRAVQDQMTAAILRQYPRGLIFGEEDSHRAELKTGSVWVIDPIDGTTNFIVQKADFAILLAYFEDGVGQFGLIYDVMADELYHGGGRFPVYKNDQLLPAYQDKPLGQSLIGINTGLYSSDIAGLASLCEKTLGTRSFGSAGISMAYVLTGRLTAYASYIYPWDYAAGTILGEKLGYSLLPLLDEEIDYDSRQLVLLLPSCKINEVKGILRQHDIT